MEKESKNNIKKDDENNQIEKNDIKSSKENEDQHPQEVKINNQYLFKSTDRLGSGSFGQIFKGINLKNKEEVAIKFESKNNPTPQLLHEYKILKIFQNKTGFPKQYCFTSLDDTLVLVFELLGSNLENLMKKTKTKTFSLKTTLMLGIQILNRIQDFHEAKFIHRDIKPENFTIGLKKNETNIYMIDFGLSRKYMDKNEHIPYKEGKNLTGTARFASIYTHMGIEQSRRDDLEGLGYMLYYFLKGSLPWDDVIGKTKKEKYFKIKEKKMHMKPEILFKEFDKGFVDYMNDVRKLQFDETPDYKKLKNYFELILTKNNFKNDLDFDWCNRKKSISEYANNKGNALDFKKSSLFNISPEALFSKLKGAMNNKNNEENKADNNKSGSNDSNNNKEKNNIDNNKNINDNNNITTSNDKKTNNKE